MVGSRLSARFLSAGPWADARWLVLAPHADDETLGAGALIAETAAEGRLAATVFLTDGAGSHPPVDTASPGLLTRMRRQEAGRALRCLGDRHAPVFLDWPDAEPAEDGSARFEASRRRLAALCRVRRVDAIAVTAGDEPHCDHAAAFRLARAVVRTALRPIRLFEYVVWAQAAPTAPGRIWRTAAMPAGRRASALAAHRSQLTPLFGPGFRVPADKARMPSYDLLYEAGALHGR